MAVRAPFSFFADRMREPSRASLRKALAGACLAWDDLEAYLAETYGLRDALHFMYGERYGWAFRFRRGERLVLAMYPNEGRVTVQVILGRAQVAAATAMRLPARVSRVLKAAKDYPEGRWLFIPVKSLESARELRPLIALKISRPTPGGATGQAKGVARSRRTGG